MSAGERLPSLFQGKRFITEISLDELNKERAQLEQEEGRLASKVQQLESQKESLFTQCKDEPSQRQQMIVARKIKELGVQVNNYNKSMCLFSSQIRTLNGFILLKELQQFDKDGRVSSLINKMSFFELQQLIEKPSSRVPVSTDEDEDADTLSIVSAMREAAAEEEDPQVALEQGMKKADQILEKKEEEIA